MWDILLQAPFMARSNLKPRGYNGDSEMMRMIYDDDYQGDSTFGKILHKFSVDQPAAQSVRNRKIEIVKRIREREKAARLGKDEKFRILSVACGPAIEIGDLLKSGDDCSRMHFSLLDQDKHALTEAASLINVLEKSLLSKISMDLIEESARIMLVNPDFIDRWGSFHFIYSMGLFDYFAKPVASTVLKQLYGLLNPGGELVIGNFHPSNPSRCFMEYWHDWKLIYRTEEEFLDLSVDLDGAESSVFYDELNIQMFLCIRKLN
jgi:extracellular factor (EF) 3-hydroxypalmitic acid methyl ester biosynthesis protein